jgi:type II secretory pathway pseudopilin PulG
VIIGVLAAFGVPKFLASVEKSKATEAFNFWAAVQSAQERYLAQNGQYCSYGSTLPTTLSSTTLDIILPKLQYFSFSTCTTTGDTGSAGLPTWTGTLTRVATTSSYGGYTVNWSDTGWDSTSASTITLYPQICPVSIAAGS